MNESRQVTVVVGKAREADLESVAKELQAKGLLDVRTLPDIGLIQGRISEAEMNSLYDVPGVEHVQPESEICLPPVQVVAPEPTPRDYVPPTPSPRKELPPGRKSRKP